MLEFAGDSVLTLVAGKAESINWALDWAFRVAGAHCVRLTVYSYNVRAIQLYERIGFVKEGVNRESIYLDRQWYDTILYSMLESEWAAKRRLPA